MKNLFTKMALGAVTLFTLSGCSDAPKIETEDQSTDIENTNMKVTRLTNDMGLRYLPNGLYQIVIPDGKDGTDTCKALVEVERWGNESFGGVSIDCPCKHEQQTADSNKTTQPDSLVHG